MEIKKILKCSLYSLGSVIGALIIILLIIYLWLTITGNRNAKINMALAGPVVQTITKDGLTFRDLNKNGKIDIYEDFRQPREARVNDLLSQMTLGEKAGLMFITQISIGKDGSIMEKPSPRDLFSFMSPGTSAMLFGKNMNHFNIAFGTKKALMAEWCNNLQKLAERSRLGIPVTIASDPRNQISNYMLASAMTGDFSVWPEQLGLAAIGDSLTTARFADIVRQEYLAVGIRVSLHPMADLATEPRWSRINGTFGEDANISSRLISAYIKGLQGDSLGPWSVACMTKHFPGGGPQKEGIDPHFPVAKGQIYPGHNFNYHLIPFEAAFKAGTAEIMPYYGVPMGQTNETVGMSFNKEIITGLLRNKYHFEGLVCTDWGIISDTKFLGFTILPARSRGMEKASIEERLLKVIDAGVDQIGGESIPDMLVKFVKNGKIKEARLDSSVRRLLRVKFVLGLFDNPFVDVQNAEKIVGNPVFLAEGQAAQRKSIVLLKNAKGGSRNTLPLKEGIKIFIQGISPEIAAKYGKVVKNPKEADFAIIRLNTPTQYIRGTGIFGRYFSSGDLDFKANEKSKILKLLSTVPNIVDICINRPAVIPEIAETSAGLLANFGASDDAVLDVIFGRFNPQGKLPVEMPSSMEAVRSQKEDVPYDSKNPLFPFGYGLSY